MTSTQALTEIRGYASAGRVRFTRHALQRMAQRGAREADVLYALTNAAGCVADGVNWKATGPDMDGDELTAIVVIEGGLLVVTVF